MSAVSKFYDARRRWLREAGYKSHWAMSGSGIGNAAQFPFQLNAYVTRVYDGDTIYVDVDWGKRRWDKDQPIRLLGCNAAELKTPGGDAAAANLQTMLPVGTWVGLATVKDDKFAPRWDCMITHIDATGAQTDLVRELIIQQWAAPWDGNGTKPVPPWPRTV